MSNRGQAWAVTAVIFGASIAVTINQFKVPPVLPALMSELNTDMVTGGWLMSVFSVAAVVLAIPAAFVISRLGARASGVLAMGCVAAGSVVGALAPNATVLMIGRAVEGISVGIMAILAPMLISLWFPPGERGLPMGIWAAWVPVGNFAIFNVAHLVADPLGWRAVWWFGALLALGALGLFWLVVRVPPQAEEGVAREEVTPRAAWRLLANPAIWLLPLIFGLFTFSLIGYNTWTPSFLTEALSVAPARASFYASLLFLAAMVSNVAAGWVLNRVRNGYALLTGSLLGSTLLYLFAFRLGSVAVVAPYMLVLGFVSNFVPTAVFTLEPELVPDPKLTGIALAVVNVVSNLGVLLGPPLAGATVSTGNWLWSSLFLAAVSGGGILVSLVAWRRAGAPARRERAGVPEAH